MIEELLQNPEKYRTGENYRGTNIVFPAEFKGKKLTVKKPRFAGDLINALYVFEDKFFYGTRRLSTSRQRLEREAGSLERLEGLNSPELVAYGNNVLVREYLEGTDFRNLKTDEDKQKALDGGFNGLTEIHDKDVIIGDAHVKNLLLGDEAYWMDFDGNFDESDLTRAKAVDVLKFVYSTYTATRDNDIALYSAELASKKMNGSVRELVRRMVGLSTGRLWLPTRLPLNGKLSNDIARVLCCE